MGCYDVTTVHSGMYCPNQVNHSNCAYVIGDRWYFNAHQTFVELIESRWELRVLSNTTVITTDTWRYANGVGEAILVCEKFRLQRGSTTGSGSPHKSIVIPLPIAGIVASAEVNTGNSGWEYNTE